MGLSSLVFNMKRLKILTTIYFLYFSGVLADPTIDDNETTNEAMGDEEEKETCDEIFTNNGMNYTSFYEGAAHGIHSLSLEEIRHFFKADALKQNRIPAVNIDFRSENVTHFNAPITHQYHIHEIYEKAAVIYNKLVENPPNDVNGICACANDLTENGVMTEVVNNARQLKDIAGQSRSRRQADTRDTCRRCRDYRSCDGGCRWCSHCRRGRCADGCPRLSRCLTDCGYGCCRRCRHCRSGKRSADTDEEEENTKALIKNYFANSTEETAEEIVSSSLNWKAGTLVGPEFDNWVPYASMLTYSLPDEKGIRDFAHFIYCMLNHQKNLEKY